MLNQCAGVAAQQFSERISNIVFTIHCMSAKNMRLELKELSGCDSKIESNDVALLRFTVGGEAWVGRLKECEDSPTESYKYDESVVVELTHFDAGQPSIRLLEESPYTPIETLIAMTKALHFQAYPNATREWVFCKWESQSWPLPGKLTGTTIRVVQALGSRLTKSEIILDGSTIGQIYFSARKAA